MDIVLNNDTWQRGSGTSKVFLKANVEREASSAVCSIKGWFRLRRKRNQRLWEFAQLWH